MPGNIRSVSVAWAVLVLCSRLSSTGAAPICTNGQAGCHVLSLANLFDRVIQHSARMHGISNDLHSKFREELTEVILKLLVAWRDPLWHFHQSMAHHHDFNNFSSNKALEMSDMVHELRKGVERVAEKMQMLGIISNSVSSQASPEALLPSDSAEWRLMKDYDLLYCFRRDSNKVQNYLKILKCRIVPEHGC
ncbi:prolactin-like isoform X2 [Xiphias gladius]|uniref:prolactin-like isoform X2 n=1 Tax=Xiphias gladius TaxID=8245 RepID=UPI001A9A26BF|nr:prolactin-like isoform X2 [Xiphias gladius]